MAACVADWAALRAWLSHGATVERTWEVNVICCGSVRSNVGRAILMAVATCAAMLMTGCTAEAADSVPAVRVHVVSGFDQPESARHDATQDVWFVSNMAGYGSAADGVGYIARFSAADPQYSDVFAQSGVRGVVLNAPKGLALAGDTLWTADITMLRAFDRRTAAPLGTIDLAPHGAVLLNAIAVTPHGTMYVTDSGIVMSDAGILYTDSARIFAVSANGSVRVVARGPELRYPNGIAWDAANARLVVASFHPFVGELYAIDPASGTKTSLAVGPGRFDGLQLLDDGRIVVSSWVDSSLHVVEADSTRRIVHGLLWHPADFGIDGRRGIVAVPLPLNGRVELWQLPPR